MQGSHAFSASLLWTLNLFAAAITGLAIAISLPFVLAFLSHTGVIPPLGLGVDCLLAFNALLLILAYFPGNLGVYWPYAVEVSRPTTVRLSGPFKRVAIPISHIGEIEDSFFWQGYVVKLTRPHGALIQFVIPWYFGPERKNIASAIKSVIEQRDTQS